MIFDRQGPKENYDDMIQFKDLERTTLHTDYRDLN